MAVSYWHAWANLHFLGQPNTNSLQLVGTLGVLAAAAEPLRPAPKQLDLLALLYRRAAASQSLAVRLYWALATGQHTAKLAAQLLLDEPVASLEGHDISSGEPPPPLPAAWRVELRRQQLLVDELAAQVGRLHHERERERREGLSRQPGASKAAAEMAAALLLHGEDEEGGGVSSPLDLAVRLCGVVSWRLVSTADAPLCIQFSTQPRAVTSSTGLATAGHPGSGGGSGKYGMLVHADGSRSGGRREALVHQLIELASRDLLSGITPPPSPPKVFSRGW
jgi:hypothetical protein